MPGQPPPHPPARRSSASSSEDVADQLLPDVTSDERDRGWGDEQHGSDDDRLLREVPPHHGG
ncbi:hypothetical protein [Motilibacter rhizosphaerae]|uniref:hypothetical protein n=1 Tax=Motilibacter rhizosphaerae TaxID=598652 RepID=UPI00102B5418|nr:hypothetical protein [Motilibacter rhizosphaerae]